MVCGQGAIAGRAESVVCSRTTAGPAGHVLTAWVTLCAHRMGDTSEARCLGKLNVVAPSGGDF